MQSRGRSIIAGKALDDDDTSWRPPPPPSIEISLLPLKKRAASNEAGSGGAGDSFAIPPKKRRLDTGSDASSSGARDSFVIPPKKRRLDTGSDVSSGGAGDDLFVIPPKKRRLESDAATSAHGNIPVQTTHRHDTANAPPEPSSSVTSSDPPSLRQKKLKHNSVRRGGVRPVRRHSSKRTSSSARGKKNNQKKTQRPRQSARGAGLSARLEALGATMAPRFVCTKTLHKSDVCRNQNRLLMSCKGEFLAEHPITALLTEQEAYLVFNKLEHGLRVNAYDGDGREFEMRLRYLDSNGGYRLIDRWGAFVEANGLGKAVADGSSHVNVELWAFRSPELPEQPPLKNEERQQIVDGLEGHPEDSKLGLLLLPYVDGGADEEMELGPPVRETKRQASAKAAAREERRLADHAVRASRGKKAVAREVTFAEMIMEHGLQMAEAVKGLLTLTYTVMSCPRSNDACTRGQTSWRPAVRTYA